MLERNKIVEKTLSAAVTYSSQLNDDRGVGDDMFSQHRSRQHVHMHQYEADQGGNGGRQRNPWKSGGAAARACRQASRVWRGRTCRRASQSVARPFAPLLGCFQIRTPPSLKERARSFKAPSRATKGGVGGLCCLILRYR